MSGERKLIVGDWVIFTKPIAGWCEGDMSKILYISGEFADVDDSFGGIRNKKGRHGIQRVKLKHLELFGDYQKRLLEEERGNDQSS